MQKQRLVWRWMLGIISLVILLCTSQFLLSAKAATNHDANEFITSATVTNGPDFKHNDTIKLQYHLDFGETALNEGDTVTLKLPDNLKPRTENDTFEVTDKDGTVIGHAQVSNKEGNEVVITMNDALVGKTNDSMTLNLATKYRGTDVGEKDIIFNDSNSSVINIVADEANMSKKGTLQENGTVKWTILVDRQQIDMSNLKISDTIGANQTLVKDFNIYDGEWTDSGSYKRKDKIDSSAYDITYTSKGFDLAFKDTVSNLIVIDYYTEVTDQDLITSGYKFKNKAVMT